MESIIQVIESHLAAKDPYTVGHQRQVAPIASSLARKMGFWRNRSTHCRWPRPFMRLEKFQFLLISYRNREICQSPTRTTQIVFQPHERLNGSGYPLGLSGEEIFLEARIWGVADVVDAVAFPRPDRPSLGIGKALDELSQQKGSFYDPSVMNAFTRLYSGNMFGNFFPLQGSC